jgi:hypothetical protein
VLGWTFYPEVGSCRHWWWRNRQGIEDGLRQGYSVVTVVWLVVSSEHFLGKPLPKLAAFVELTLVIYSFCITDYVRRNILPLAVYSLSSTPKLSSGFDIRVFELRTRPQALEDNQLQIRHTFDFKTLPHRASSTFWSFMAPTSFI